MKKLILALILAAGVAYSDGMVHMVDPITGSNTTQIIVGVPALSQVYTAIRRWTQAVTTNSVVQTLAEGTTTNVIAGYAVKYAFTNLNYNAITNLPTLGTMAAQAATNYVSQTNSTYTDTVAKASISVATNLPAYTNAVALASSAVQTNASAYTNAVALAGTSVQPTLAAYTNALALAGSSVQTNNSVYTNTVAKAVSALQSESSWIAASNSVVYTNNAKLAAAITSAVSSVAISGVTNTPDASGVLHMVLEKDITGAVTNIVFQ